MTRNDPMTRMIETRGLMRSPSRTSGRLRVDPHRHERSTGHRRWFELRTKCQLSDDKYTKQELAEFTDLLNAAKGSPANA